MKTHTFVVEVKVPFKKSRKKIKKWLEDSLKDEAECIPLYVEGDIDEAKIKVKVKDEKDHIRRTDRQRSGWPDDW
jgi:hypothetical protein